MGSAVPCQNAGAIKFLSWVNRQQKHWLQQYTLYTGLMGREQTTTGTSMNEETGLGEKKKKSTPKLRMIDREDFGSIPLSSSMIHS